mmetsp:Transcript_2134/g.8227  ORF Transcript_2134/g.8227 Transcript_2134/m.8227 type:complete len:213 (-) Transcript_2134:238-876(-)
MVPSGPTSAPGWSCASRLEYPVRLFCARLCSASKDSALARLVRSPAFHRALLRPPSPSPPRPSPSRFICDRFFALAVVAAMLGSALRGRGRLAAPRVLACRRLSRTPHALHSVLAPPGPLRHKGVVCVLQCAHLLPGMPGNRALASPPEPMSMVVAMLVINTRAPRSIYRRGRSAFVLTRRSLRISLPSRLVRERSLRFGTVSRLIYSPRVL